MADVSLLDLDATFASLSNLIDARILRSLADMGFARPTVVQAKAIPLALEGRDILARARTGSGKTAAYCIPVVQKILNAKTVCAISSPLNLTRSHSNCMSPVACFNVVCRLVL